MAKFTAAQIKEQTKKILDAIEKEKRRQPNQNTTQVKPEDIEKKLKRVTSPMIAYQGWSGPVSPGGSLNYNVGIWNPDPKEAFAVFAHTWVGSGNVDPVVGTFLQNVDTRFARLTEPAYGGGSIKPSTMLALNFTIPVPAGVQKTNYLGNTCLMQFNWLDAGTYLDRSVWVFAVT